MLCRGMRLKLERLSEESGLCHMFTHSIHSKKKKANRRNLEKQININYVECCKQNEKQHKNADV